MDSRKDRLKHKGPGDLWSLERDHRRSMDSDENTTHPPRSRDADSATTRQDDSTHLQARPDAHRSEADLAALRHEGDTLRAGLHTRGRVGIAIGIVMCHFHLDDKQALRVLIRHSQDTNQKLNLVAEDVIRSRGASLSPEKAGREARS